MATEAAAEQLYAHIRGRSRAVIESEVQRLARRAQRLSERDLATIESTLDELAENLILDRLQKLPHLADRLGGLFGADDLASNEGRRLPDGGKEAKP